MSRNNLPAIFGESHPGLALATDKIVVPHLELKVDRREIAPSVKISRRAYAALFDTGARWAGHPARPGVHELCATCIGRCTSAANLVTDQ
jgi:hypothetical protein